MAAAAQSRTRQEAVIARRAMACEFSVTLPAGTRSAVDAGCAALDEVERVEAKLSAYRYDSELSRINRRECGSADAEVFGLLRLAANLSRATGGAFDAATGALVKAWGFYQGPKRVPPARELEAARAVSGMSHVRLIEPGRRIEFTKRGTEWNLGAIGKGYAIDRALRVVEHDFGARAALVQGGQSSIRALGAWPVAIGEPTFARLWLRDAALGTSGAANQFFVHEGHRYGHILDPRTGWPATGLVSASVIAPTAAEADALSTAFYVLGVEGAREFCRLHPRVAAILYTGAEMIVAGNVEVEVLQ
jgi:thiamine biosynthesis lipoprotein